MTLCSQRVPLWEEKKELEVQNKLVIDSIVKVLSARPGRKREHHME